MKEANGYNTVASKQKKSNTGDLAYIMAKSSGRKSHDSDFNTTDKADSK